MGYDFFESFHTLTLPYAAPSVLHIAVLFSIGPAHKLAAVQPETQIMDWVFAQEIKPFEFTYVLSHPILRPEWPQFLLAAHAKAKHASRRAARSHSVNTFCCLLSRVLEGRGLCLCWLAALLCSSADLTFCGPVNQQTVGTPRQRKPWFLSAVWGSEWLIRLDTWFCPDSYVSTQHHW